jgi:hypothetical protein
MCVEAMEAVGMEDEMEHSLRASSPTVPEPAGQNGAAKPLQAQHLRSVTAYRWQSTAGIRLVKLHGISLDLRECRECLRFMVERPRDRFSRFLVFAALTCYRRASDGWISKSFDGGALDLGAGASATHEKLIGLAHRLSAHSLNPSGEATIGIIVHDNEIADVDCRLELIGHEDAPSVTEVIDHVDLIETQIIRPEIERSKAQVLNEARTLGIQLVRHLPAVQISPA